MIYIGSDHRGFTLKEKLKNFVSKEGYEYEDVGSFEYNKDDDYPDFAEALARKVAIEKGNRGILICGSGIGVCIAANKIKKIRAGTIYSPSQARASVNDEDTNVLCLSADNVDEDVNMEIVREFLSSKFSGEERHLRRIAKIEKIESE